MSHTPSSHVERLPGDVRYCPKCGQANSSPARYCATCGISMTATIAEIERPGGNQAEGPLAETDASPLAQGIAAAVRRILSARR
jgi:hypothetical protein